MAYDSELPALATEESVRIAHWLCASATVTDGQAQWTKPIANPLWPRVEGVIWIQTDGSFYGGGAGIAYALLRIARIHPEQRFLTVAAAALRHAVASAGEQPLTPFSHHTGLVGLLSALFETKGTHLEPEMFGHLHRLLNSLVLMPMEDEGIDVIAGSAGAIVPLLKLGRRLDDSRCFDLARRLADHLITRAHYGPFGWSWGGPFRRATKDLCGYAHGVSGAVHALLEMFAATGDERYASAARCGIAHEDRCFDANEGNWPDYRQPEILPYLTGKETTSLGQDLVAGKLFNTSPRFMRAWCHGSPGIAPVRARARKLLGSDEPTTQLAEVAVLSTLKTLRVDASGYSICHGHFGNAELARLSAEMLDRQDWCAAIDEFVVAVLRSRCDANWERWPSGAMNGLPDPTLFLGEAGIALALLRFAGHFKDSVLFETLDTPPVATWNASGAKSQVVDWVTGMLPRLNEADPARTRSAASEAFDDGIENIVRRTLHKVRQSALRDRSHASRLSMALSLEEIRHELAQRQIDVARQYLQLEHKRALRPESLTFELSQDVVIECLGEGAAATACAVLIFREGESVRDMPLNAFQYGLLTVMRPAGTADDLVERLRDSVDVAVETSTIRSIIEKQLSAWYLMPFLLVRPEHQISVAEGVA